MNLSPGTRLGPYEVTAPLGAGGMGEVYRARDTRLGREVALKVLPSSLSSSLEVRARFEREARTVSALNHPNICVLHDVGREGETDYLVLELIEGETLASRLLKGPLPTPDVLRIGSEIADALSRAHGAGVVHRDLKPGNIMLARSGAKLMDFGLARPGAAVGGTPGAAGSATALTALTQSPTMAQPLTAEGTIVGTFQYMAPEQLEGREADARSDVWGLGCVLYEMATGKRAFEGRSQASLISAIMGSDPAPISQLAPMAPAALDRLVRGCLAKDPADRLQSAHDIRLQLSWIAEGGSQAGVPAAVSAKRRGPARLPWVVAALAVVVAGASATIGLRPRPDAPHIHASLLPPPGVLFSSSTDSPLPLAISPDGSMVAFCARAGEGPDRLWVRTLGRADARPLDGTEDAEGPFFSPDGRSLGFYAGSSLKRVDVAGGPVITLVRGVDPRGGTWNRDGVILFTRNSFGPVWRVSADGGAIMTVTALDTSLAEFTHRYPHFLPDGRHFLYLARRAGAGPGETPKIYVGSLGKQERRQVMEIASNVIYASGHLVYVRGSILVAQRFDLGSLQVRGPVVTLVDDVRMDARYSRGVFSTSAGGVLVCMTGGGQTRTQLRWLDRAGRPLGDVGEPADYTYGGTPNISPDGRSAVMAIANRDRGTSETWLIDLASGRRRKLAVDTRDHPSACWLPDGRSVVVNSTYREDGGLDAITIDGTRSWKILRVNGNIWPSSAHGDNLLCYVEQDVQSQLSNWDIHVVPLSGGTGSAPFIASKALESGPQFSPDGRWAAYVSDETGRVEMSVAAFPQPGGRWQVSQGGGTEPRWSRDGRELIYVDSENYLVSVDVLPSASGFETGASRRLFQFHGAGGIWRYDVAPGGDRFLVTVPLEQDLASPVTVITDWTRRMGDR